MHFPHIWDTYKFFHSIGKWNEMSAVGSWGFYQNLTSLLLVTWAFFVHNQHVQWKKLWPLFWIWMLEKSNILKPQDSFGRFVIFFLDLQKWTIPSESTIEPIDLQLLWMTCCNVIIPNNNVYYQWQSVWGDPEHVDILVISWQCEHFWANIWQGMNNSHRTIKLWFNEENIFIWFSPHTKTIHWL